MKRRKRRINWRRFSLVLLFILVISIGYNRVEALIAGGGSKAVTGSPAVNGKELDGSGLTGETPSPAPEAATSSPPKATPTPTTDTGKAVPPSPSISPSQTPNVDPSPSAQPDRQEEQTSPPPQGTGADEAGEEKRIALTFDDGPDLKWTPQILEILKERNIKATFFLVGKQAEAYPEMVQQIIDEGHLVGNHTWGHEKLTELNTKEVGHAIDRLSDLLFQITGQKISLFRAPYGAMSDKVQSVLDDKGYQLVGWTVDPRDWAGTSPDEMMNIVKKQAKPGGIVLMHSFGGKNSDLSNTVEFLPQLIDYLQEEGYTIVTVPELSP